MDYLPGTVIRDTDGFYFERSTLGRDWWRMSQAAPGQPHEPVEIVFPRSILDQISGQLRSFATLVRPGETLVVLASPDWTPTQLGEINRVIGQHVAETGAQFDILFVPGTAFAIGETDDQDGQGQEEGQPPESELAPVAPGHPATEGGRGTGPGQAHASGGPVS